MLTKEFDALWERLSERLGEEANKFAAESREAASQAAELLALPPRGRARALRAEARFHSMALVLELIRRARAELERAGRPMRALPALKTALQILRRLRTRSRRSGLPVGGRELQAEALCELGEAWRRLGVPGWAESCLEQAARALRESPDSLARAFLCSRLARLRVDQGRRDEAVALYTRAARLWDDVGDDEQSREARREQGRMDAERAAGALQEREPGLW
jgi:tetratricopeptide (TPR) repeat protein